MNIYLIYNCDYFDKNTVEEPFKKEFETALLYRGEIGIILYDDQDGTIKVLRETREPSNLAIYRGWMRNEEEYTRLYNIMYNCERMFKLINTPEQYLNSHHLPKWYEKIKDLTFNTHIFPFSEEDYKYAEEKINRIYENLSPSGNFSLSKRYEYIIKDYIKSRKDEHDAFRVDFTNSKDEAIHRFYKRQRHEGVFTGGIVLREYENIIDENRYLVFKGKLTDIYVETEDLPLRKILYQAIAQHDSNFYTIDIATLANNKYKIIEIGDGQVSSLTPWWFTNIDVVSSTPEFTIVRSNY